ncbi:hypothetical protein ABZ863_22370 [Saccharomonospora sp. NPDC046836]|uniref:hypothetical protein n=1 Tax=Saccharomonospora sp. NPDC046836 TaxID=3156921 RepID=UPI0033C119B9
MAMVRVPVDATWVRNMAELASGPWTEEAVTAAALRFGWTGVVRPAADGAGDSPAGRVELPWLDHADLFAVQHSYGDGEGMSAIASGWNMYFHEWPPLAGESAADIDPASGVELFCAGFWPPRGAEDTGDADQSTDRNELLKAADEWAVCAANPSARRVEFAAEFERIHELIRETLGEPTRTVSEATAVRAIWDRDVMALVLVQEPCALDYEAYDWIALRVASRITNGRFGSV